MRLANDGRAALTSQAATRGSTDGATACSVPWQQAQSSHELEQSIPRESQRQPSGQSEWPCSPGPSAASSPRSTSSAAPGWTAASATSSSRATAGKEFRTIA